MAAASTVHTIAEHGPDRVAGFSPIPAMSQVSYAAGSRFLSLVGGTIMSFYDWYCDLPPASPETWGEQTDVCESADWYNARFIAVVGSNLNMTRTPDTHYIAEVRHAGAKLTVFSPDFSQVAKYADWWIPANPGQDTAFWLAVDHVLLTEPVPRPPGRLLPSATPSATPTSRSWSKSTVGGRGSTCEPTASTATAPPRTASGSC